MNSEQSLARIRQFLLIISAGVFVMTVTELFFESLDGNNTITSLPSERLGADRSVSGIFSAEPCDDQPFALVYGRDRTLQFDRYL